MACKKYTWHIAQSMGKENVYKRNGKSFVRHILSKKPMRYDNAALYKVSKNKKSAICVFIGEYCECVALMEALA